MSLIEDSGRCSKTKPSQLVHSELLPVHVFFIAALIIYCTGTVDLDVRISKRQNSDLGTGDLR